MHSTYEALIHQWEIDNWHFLLTEMDSEKKKNPQGDGEGMCQKEKKKKV